MPTRIGTSNYVSLAHATRAYGKKEAQDKINDGSISVGKPTLNNGESLVFDEKGRYFIVVPEKVTITAQTKKFYKTRGCSIYYELNYAHPDTVSFASYHHDGRHFKCTEMMCGESITGEVVELSSDKLTGLPINLLSISERLPAMGRMTAEDLQPMIDLVVTWCNDNITSVKRFKESNPFEWHSLLMTLDYARRRFPLARGYSAKYSELATLLKAHLMYVQSVVEKQ